MRKTIAVVAALLCITLAFAETKRPLSVDDIYNLKEVRDPQRSPDGKWVAYAVARAVKDTDKNDTDLWMVSWDGREQVQLTSSAESETTPPWPPDGTRIAMVVNEPDPSDPDPELEKKETEKKPPKPIVIDRYHFKADVS